MSDGSPMESEKPGSDPSSPDRPRKTKVMHKTVLPSKRSMYSDRLVPSRKQQSVEPYALQDVNAAADSIIRYTSAHEETSPGYALLLQSVVLGMRPRSPISADKHTQLHQLGRLQKRKIFTYRTNEEERDEFALSLFGDGVLDANAKRQAPRRIAKTPYKVLDAPALADDFYLNLVDWSSENLLAVGLGNAVYLWNAATSKVTKLCDMSSANQAICSVAFSQMGLYLAVGLFSGEVHIYDINSYKKTHRLTGHRQRVGTMVWSTTHLSTGSRDRRILHHDLRTQTAVHDLNGHTSEVCGLKWSGDDRQLASGGNDNRLCIWELRSSTSPMVTFQDHTAAVKAIAWSPHQHGLLASGGGTADRHIRFWSTSTERQLNSVDTGSQVCNLSWSKNVNELVSTHGYSQNQVVVWRYPEMTKLSTLTGHSLRVLYLAVSPDGQTIVTGAGDETLRFWSVFPPLNGQSSPGNNISMHSHFR